MPKVLFIYGLNYSIQAVVLIALDFNVQKFLFCFYAGAYLRAVRMPLIMPGARLKYIIDQLRHILSLT